MIGLLGISLKNVTKPKNDANSLLFFGCGAFTIAFIFDADSCNPFFSMTKPRTSNLLWINLHLARLNRKLHSCSHVHTYPNFYMLFFRASGHINII